MLSKKSPQTSCRVRIRNDRIGANGFLNQRCALAPDLESILRARMSKIVFRQHRPAADIEPISPAGVGLQIGKSLARIEEKPWLGFDGIAEGVGIRFCATILLKPEATRDLAGERRLRPARLASMRAAPAEERRTSSASH